MNKNAIIAYIERNIFQIIFLPMILLLFFFSVLALNPIFEGDVNLMPIAIAALIGVFIIVSSFSLMCSSIANNAKSDKSKYHKIAKDFQFASFFYISTLVLFIVYFLVFNAKESILFGVSTSAFIHYLKEALVYLGIISILLSSIFISKASTSIIILTIKSIFPIISIVRKRFRKIYEGFFSISNRVKSKTTVRNYDLDNLTEAEELELATILSKTEADNVRELDKLIELALAEADKRHFFILAASLAVFGSVIANAAWDWAPAFEYRLVLFSFSAGFVLYTLNSFYKQRNAFNKIASARKRLNKTLRKRLVKKQSKTLITNLKKEIEQKKKKK